MSIDIGTVVPRLAPITARTLGQWAQWLPVADVLAAAGRTDDGAVKATMSPGAWVYVRVGDGRMTGECLGDSPLVPGGVEVWLEAHGMVTFDRTTGYDVDRDGDWRIIGPV